MRNRTQGNRISVPFFDDLQVQGLYRVFASVNDPNLQTPAR